MTRFRILGPLEVWDGDRPVDVGGGRQRALLARLLLSANEVVSTDRLIDELWGESPPPTAGKALQGLVSQLRRSVGPGGGLETRAPGYVLRLEPGELDSLRFAQLVEEGRRALAGGDPESAARLLREALALWRGAPLTEFAFEAFAQSEIRRLEEVRLAALEERIEADLALGQHVTLIGELEGLVAAHPLRERLRGELMLALYRGGRQAEALSAYREGRRILVEELGIEPGQALQQLEKAILTQDPSLEPLPARPPARPAARPLRRVPRRLRLAVAGLVLAAAVAIGSVLLTRGADAPVVVADSIVRIDPATNAVAEVVRVGRFPDQVAVAGPYVFVVNVEDRAVSRLDTRSGQVLTTGVGVRHPFGLAGQDESTIWIGSSSSPEVVRLDAETLDVERRLTLPSLAAPLLAAGGGSLWVTQSVIGSNSVRRDSVFRIDLATSQLTRAYETGNIQIAVAYGENAAWVVNHGDSTVTRVGADGSATSFPVGHQATDVAAGFGSVWVLSDDDDTLWRLRRATGRPQAIVPVGDGPWEVAAGAGAVWVTNSEAGTVSRIDPETNLVVATIHTGFEPHGIAVGAGGVWVAIGRGDAG